MKKLKWDEVKEIVTDMFEQSKGYGGFQYDENDIVDAVKVFYRVIQEDINKELSIEGQRRLVENIAHDIGKGKTMQKVEFFYSDFEHFTYGDNFLRQGESEKILKALIDNGINVGVLRDLIPFRDYNEPAKYVNIDGKRVGVKITQKVTKDDNGSPVIESLTIKLGNKIIYKYTREKTDADIDEESDVSYYLEDITEFAQQKQTKSGKTPKTIIKLTEEYYGGEDSSSEIYKVWSTKKGESVRDRGGRFVSKNISNLILGR